jgi:hypothetical protein
MNVYFISGLGADERIFYNLTLPEKIRIVYIKWPEIEKGETLRSYCIKISSQIDTTKEFGLVGVSFGGIVATELTKLIKPKATIIISSVSSRKELPALYKMLGYLKINKVFPVSLLNKVYPFTFRTFGVQSKEDKELLVKIITGTTPKFLKWAINEVLHWENTIRPSNLFHIHGSSDHVFPINLTKADITIDKGGHLIVHTNAKTISQILTEKLGIS